MAEAEKSGPLLSLRGLVKRYPGLIANDQISLDIGRGEIHAILGENGAGKSTLMKMIYGVEQPDEGEIFWDGRNITGHDPAKARALGLGMVFQHFSLFETLTVTENIALTIRAPKAELARRVRELGAAYDLEVDAHAAVHSLSVGERQRVEIIRNLMLDPKLLILDEPTSVLPPQHIEALFTTLRRLREAGVSMIFISHKLEEIRAICDRATILRAGKVTGTVRPEETSASELARLMIGREIPKVEPRARDENAGAPMLEISGLNAASADPFGVSLKDISLTLRAGEILGVAGVSGNGQSELSRLISGEDLRRGAPAGAIRICGRDAAHLGPKERRRLGFAFVPEERLGRGAAPGLSLAANALLTANEQGMVRGGFINRATLRAFAQRCIKDFDVRCSGPEAPAASLSGGNLQKYIVGREVMLAPKLFLLAQPTWGVDIGAATEIRRKLLELRDQGVAILVISEELEELMEISDRIQVIHSGRLSRSIPAAEATAERLGRYMIGAEDEHHAHSA